MCDKFEQADDLNLNNICFIGRFLREYPLESGEQPYWTTFLGKTFGYPMGSANSFYPPRIYGSFPYVYWTFRKCGANWLHGHYPACHIYNNPNLSVHGPFRYYFP